jgi:predicted nucleic acid-binding protein
MNGRLFLDTNAIIALMSGNYKVLQLVNSANWIGVSVISEIEFLSFSKITERDKLLFQKFKERVNILDLKSNDNLLIEKICELRLKHKVKLPDATIMASAILSESTIISNDKIFIERGFEVFTF